MRPRAIARIGGFCTATMDHHFPDRNRKSDVRGPNSGHGAPDWTQTSDYTASNAFYFSVFFSETTIDFRIWGCRQPEGKHKPQLSHCFDQFDQSNDRIRVAKFTFELTEMKKMRVWFNDQLIGTFHSPEFGSATPLAALQGRPPYNDFLVHIHTPLTYDIAP